MFRLLVSLVVLIATLIVVTVEPKMHKQVMIGSKATLAENSSFETQDIKISPQNIETKTEQVKIKPVETSVTREEYMKSVRMRAPKTPAKDIFVEPKREVKVKEKPLPQPAPVEEPKPSPVEQLNEIIVWNKWRADICNTISDNSLETQVYKLKKGVLFKYSFTVDRNRHISNIKVSLARGLFDPVVQESIQDIHKTIRSLEGKPIIEFPKGSRRTSVKVEGGIEMSDYDASVNPGNFSDIESVFH